MSFEMQKSVTRRVNDSRFLRQYFVGNGIDIGAGEDCLSKYKEFFPLITSVDSWDIDCGDAQYLHNVDDSSYDFVVSSHCLEHMVDPYVALQNWIRILKSKGHLVITIPDEDLYEQGQWPSKYNSDHKSSFTILKNGSWSPVSINIVDLVAKFSNTIIVKKIELLDNLHLKYFNGDQTRYSCSEGAIEIILQKK